MLLLFLCVESGVSVCMAAFNCEELRDFCCVLFLHLKYSNYTTVTNPLIVLMLNYYLHMLPQWNIICVFLSAKRGVRILIFLAPKHKEYISNSSLFKCTVVTSMHEL